MPRTKLDPDYWREYGRDYIRKKASEKEVSQKQIAGSIGETQPSVSKKLKTMNFTIEEFRAVIKDTGMSDEVILRIMK